MQRTHFILGRAASFITTRKFFTGASPVSKEVMSASANAIATLAATCHQLIMLDLADCTGLSTLLERIGNCVVLKIPTLARYTGDCSVPMTLNLSCYSDLTAPPEWLGDCMALKILKLLTSQKITTRKQMIMT